MHRARSMPRILLFSALCVAAMAAACSSTKDGDELTFDTEGGDELALKMLPAPEVLPGSGWRFSEVDPEDEDDDAEDDGESESCQGFENAFDEIGEELDVPAGQAEGEYTLPVDEDDPFAIPVSVSLQVEIHEDRDLVKRGLEVFEEVINSDAFEECMREAAQQGFDESEPVEGIEFGIERADPSAEAPRDGSGLAMDMTATFASLTIEMRFEMYAWRIGNAIEFAFIMGSGDALTTDFVRTVLDRADGAAVVAASQ